MTSLSSRRKSHDSPIKILFLAADPSDASRLRLGQELRDIQERLQLAQFREKFVLEQRWSVRPGDISQAILDFEPQVVHFSGHGRSTGDLCVEDNAGMLQPLQPSSLAALFELVADQVRCVVLNACYSELQAEAIAKHIEFVVGMNQAIGDRAAIAFSVGFYKALGADRPIEKAYDFGRVEIQLQGIEEHLTPVLHKKNTRAEIKRVSFTLVLTATIDEVDKPLAEAIVAHLRKVSGDASLTLERIELGSVRFVLEGFQNGLEQLQILFQSGQLTEVLGIPIQDIQSTVATSQKILPRVEQLGDLERHSNDAYTSTFADIRLNREEPEVLYYYLLDRVRVDSPAQLTERFRRLFIDAVEETDSRIQSVMDKISDPRFPVEEFNSILNRCCYTVLNRWAMRPTLHQAIPEFLELLESASPISTQPEKQQRLNERVKNFTQTDQFSVLKDLSQSMALLRLFPPVINRDLNSPLGELIQRYPYLYDNYFINRDSIDTARQIEEIVRRVKLQKQQQFEIELARYVAAQVQNSQNTPLITQAVVNPTLLNDQELVFSLKQFSGDVEGSYSERDLAENFWTRSSQQNSFSDFKGELYQYLTSAISSEYGKHSFYNQLWARLQRTSPQYDSQVVNEQLLLNTCKRLLNFLVVEGKQRREHYIFIDLLNNVGPTLTIRFLLKIVLLCRQIKPYLEQRFFVLFDHYRSQAQGSVQWLVECLENLLVALTTNFSSTDFSLIKLL